MMCVACILIHDQTMHRTLFPSFVIHDFVRSVHLDAQPNHAQNVIYPFRAFMLCVACILMHDQIMHRTLFTPFGHSRFRATSCTLRFKKNPNGKGALGFYFHRRIILILPQHVSLLRDRFFPKGIVRDQSDHKPLFGDKSVGLNLTF